MRNFNQNFHKSAIAHRLIIYVVLFSLLLTLLTTAIQSYQDYKSNIKLIKDQLQQIQDVHLKSLTATLWISDAKELKTHLEGIFQLRDMQFLEIRDPQKVWVSLGTPQSSDVMSRQYPMIYSQRGKDIKIGTLTVVVSLKGVYQRLFDKMWVTLISNTINIFLIAGFILVIFYLLVSRHLTRIADFTRKLDINSLDSELSLARRPVHEKKMDELDQVVKAINQMQVNIKESFLALEQSEERFRALASVSPVGIFRTDTKGNCIYTNERWRELAGLSETEALGDGWARALHPEDRERVFSEWYQAAADNAPFSTECRFQRPDGEIFWVLSRAEAEKNSKGEIVGHVGTVTDITERVNMEETLRRSQKMDAIGQLSGGIAHDFNNQLGVVIGYLDFLKDYTAGDEKPSKWVDTASKAVLRCMDLTRQLLAFSHRRVGNKRVVDLNASLKELKTMVARSVTPEVEVQYFLLEELWPTEIDPGEFHDAILNLVINARDAMLDGGKLLIETSNKHLDENYVAMNPEVKAGDYVQLMLSDTGTGISADVIERIFEPFFTTKPEGKGTGLGMAMVYGFVKRYGGHIKIYSEVGVGTTIRLYLPRAGALAATNITHNALEMDLPSGSESILIVDDENDLLTLAEHYLSNLGYRVRTAENAQQALAIMEENGSFDLLFSDVVMPGGMNGYELAQRITEIKPDIKVLLTSGFTSKTIAHDNLARFSSHLLHKPYRKNDLAWRIRLVLDEQGNDEDEVSDVMRSKNSLADRTILVVDDEADIRDLFELNLTRLGCKTIVAEAGDEAIALYQQSLKNNEPIDVVILDLSLPGSLGGMDVANEIRRIDAQATIIVCSGHSDATEMTHYADYGFSGALEKNFNRDIIKQVLEQALSSK